jgi:hypothetical protein
MEVAIAITFAAFVVEVQQQRIKSAKPIRASATC